MTHDGFTTQQAAPDAEPSLAEKVADAREEKGPRLASARRVFVSYSRTDQRFVRALVGALTAQGVDAWVDMDAIPKSARWRDEIAAGIEACDSFLFILSPASLASGPCRDELQYALKYNKRIIPVVCADVQPHECPPAIEELNWIFLHRADSYDAGVKDLLEAIATDLDWVHMHTYVLGRALEWETKNNDRVLLLRGTHLAAAEKWLTEAADKQPAPTALHTQYILAGRKAATGRQRLAFGVTVAGLLVAVGLALFAFAERGVAIQERIAAQSRLLTSEAQPQLDSDPQLSLLLDIQAVKLDDTPPAEAALRQAMVESHLARLPPAGVGQIFNIAFSPDGRYFAAGSAGNGARVFDARTGSALATLNDFGAQTVQSVTFSPDGRYLLEAGSGDSA